MRLKNKWKREALRAGICEAWGSIDSVLPAGARLVVSWAETAPPESARCESPITGADSPWEDERRRKSKCGGWMAVRNVDPLSSDFI